MLGTLTNIAKTCFHGLVNIVIVRGAKPYIPSTVSKDLFQLMVLNPLKSIGLQYKHRYINMHALNVFNSDQNVKSIL